MIAATTDTTASAGDSDTIDTTPSDDFNSYLACFRYYATEYSDTIKWLKELLNTAHNISQVQSRKKAIEQHYKRLLSAIFNIYPAMMFRRQPLAISGFVARAGKRRKGK
jgi:hypothetical protein